MEPLRNRNQRSVRLQHPGDIEVDVPDRMYKKYCGGRTYRTRIKEITAASLRKGARSRELAKDIQQHGPTIRPMGQQTDV